MKIHLIDGAYELFRNHFGAPPKKTRDGRQAGAALGLLRSLLMLLQSDGVILKLSHNFYLQKGLFMS